MPVLQPLALLLEAREVCLPTAEPEELIQFRQTNIEIAAEAIHQLGLIEDPQSYRLRLAALTRCLQSPDARLRESAVVGLSLMDDPHSITAVRGAVELEPSDSIRHHLNLLADQLEAAEQCRASSE